MMSFIAEVLEQSAGSAACHAQPPDTRELEKRLHSCAPDSRKRVQFVTGEGLAVDEHCRSGLTS
jgi:hypothetical protein